MPTTKEYMREYRKNNPKYVEVCRGVSLEFSRRKYALAKMETERLKKMSPEELIEHIKNIG
ncbi:hypothetical protein ES702_04928 [subsurface metagenome]